MSCNCSDVGESGLWTEINNQGETEMVPGEDVECYMKRANDPKEMNGGEDIPNKIITNAIVPDCQMKVNTKFELSQGSPSSPFVAPVVWSMVNPDSGSPMTVQGLTFSGGVLSGTIPDANENVKYNIKIIAKDGTGKEIDSRSYNFSAKKCTPGADLKFIHPLPGAVMTSPFGPRKSPTSGASTKHKGCDFAYPGHVTKDVLCACDGKVIKAGTGTGYGNVVYVQHFNGSGKLMAETRYAHLASIYVSAGQTVSAGQPLGKEGNTGIGTGAHLHFELRLAGDTPVDPKDYISGSIQLGKASVTGDGSVDSGSPSGEVKVQTNTNKALTTSKVESSQQGCKNPPNTSPALPQTSPAPADTSIAKSISSAGCKPTGAKPTVGEVKSKILETLNKYPDLDASDKEFFLTLAKVESSYDPYAKNPNTSATGLYQMVNSTAAKYFAKIGIEPSCENRCNVEYATEAMIRFYKDEILKYYKDFQNSGGTKIAGKTIKITPHSATYASLSKAVFCYGLIHHDGVGNAVNGKDVQGVQIAKKHFV